MSISEPSPVMDALINGVMRAAHACKEGEVVVTMITPGLFQYWCRGLGQMAHNSTAPGGGVEPRVCGTVTFVVMNPGLRCCSKPVACNL